jgi:hypothetical protein|tara:strand:+ start:228 stop:530 length:303 start_codon:yes stop_codon:yes gene_type:complete
MDSEQKLNFDSYRRLVDQVLIDIRPYIKTEGEQLLGSLLAQVMVKSNLVANEHLELQKAYKDLRKGYDEMKNLIFELSKKQKEINGHNTKQFKNIRKKLP